MHWNYSQINPVKAMDFRWIYGSTPMSDLKVIYTSWIIYFITIIAIRWYMAERNRIDKSNLAVLLYNGSIIICSTYVWITASYSLWQIVETNNNHQGRFFTFCDAVEYEAFSKYGGYMFYAMYQSYLIRFWAFFDTVILALRKKSIPFLHWYQHMLIILMMWSWLQDQSIFGSLATGIISFVQIFKYLYYFCNCLNIKTIWIKTLAVFFQVIQFVAAIALTGYQMSLCPQSNCVLLSASINVTMVYTVVKYYDTKEATAATTREHYKRRKQ
ncbi:ELO family [Pilaira anomala]|nr:ELO family [Pilaira anomala]